MLKSFIGLTKLEIENAEAVLVELDNIERRVDKLLEMEHLDEETRQLYQSLKNYCQAKRNKLIRVLN